MTPLQVAEKLFSAVVKAVNYKIGVSGSAIAVLASKSGDCGGMSHLYEASLRITGIPCRSICGWDNTNATHLWTEIYFPGTGWIPADTSFARLTEPSCAYMPFFGYHTAANKHVVVCRAGKIVTADMNTGDVQIGALGVTSGTPAPVVGAMTWTVALSTTPLP